MRESGAADNGRRKVLIVEDEAVNRALLGAVLEGAYDVLYAETGAAAMAIIRSDAGSLSLALLDLHLPDLYGMDILRTLRDEGVLNILPVIVLTADRDAEVESLNIGAADFISKPYPKPEVILARVKRAIELAEDRGAAAAERDPVTGLMSREAFFRAVEKLDGEDPDAPMDAIAVDVNHFHMLNERYGRDFADGVLARIGEKVAELAGETGLACRREADTFLLYCPHRDDYYAILEAICGALAGNGMGANIVRLRMGVYARADKAIDGERRFDRAKIAADTVRSTFTKAVAIYDSALHESAVFAEQLLEDFHRALEGRQFRVYYQPKYDVRGEEPALSSAEALVRWAHPEFGMISPGVFIPLFEGNGLIEPLDRFVWREAARQIREWKNRLGYSVPVSVNVSRMDLLDPGLTQRFLGLLSEYNLTAQDLLLEITESAYTQDSGRIIEAVNELRDAGFMIEMDDFGSGYSSLNMLSTLPIDALKLDMQFVRSAFKNGKNTRMLEVVLEIAASLAVPVVAEGVETAEQLFTLRALGCQVVQGYYFSKPVPAAEFERFLTENPRSDAPVESRAPQSRVAHDRRVYDAMHDPLTGLYNNSAFDILLHDADRAHIALVLADVDGYEALIADRGPRVADQVILRAAAALRDSFRSTDYVCRIREDEFAVIITRVDSSQRDVIFDKVIKAGVQLRAEADGVPAATLSAGIAFGDHAGPQSDLFQNADAALNKAKLARRSGCAVY